MSADRKLNWLYKHAPLVLAYLALESGFASAATPTVDTIVDEADGGAGGSGTSLRDAIIQANGDFADDTITLPAGTYTLTLAGTGENNAAYGDLDVIGYGNLLIEGGGVGTTFIDGNDLDRVFHLTNASGGTVTLRNLTIRNGNAVDHPGGGSADAAGGGIYNNGAALTLDNVAVYGNDALADNGADGADGVFANGQAGYGGGNAFGGGVYSYSSGSVTLLNGSDIQFNNVLAGDGGDGGDAFLYGGGLGYAGGSGGFGGFAFGGGLYAISNSVTVYAGSIVENNLARGGYGGAGGNGATGPDTGGAAGSGGSGGTAQGGGIWVNGGTLALTGATLQGNDARGGQGGGGGVGGDLTGAIGRGANGGTGGIGGTAQGGGLYTAATTANVTTTLVFDNTALGGNGSLGGNGGGGTGGGGTTGGNGGAGGTGGHAQGGGVYHYGGTFTIAQSTIQTNYAIGSSGGNGGAGGTVTTNGGDGGAGGAGGQGQGAGLYLNYAGNITDCTLSTNFCYGGNGGVGGSGGAPGGAGGAGGVGGNVMGGGLYVNFIANLVNSTVSGNVASSYGGGAGGNGSGDGGGVFVANSINIRNSTIASNTAAHYGGGLRASSSGVFSAISTILADNTAGSHPDFSNNGATLGTCTENLIEDANGHAITDATNGNIVGADPGLSALADNGGPTFTHALGYGSIAIDAGSNPVPVTNDQRGTGFPREVNGVADIGAFESQDTSVPAGNLDVRSLRITSVFRTDGKDQIHFVVRFDNPGAVPPLRTRYPFEGLAVAFDIGEGAQFNFVLDARGRAGRQCKATYLKRTNQIQLELHTGVGDFKNFFTDDGLINARILDQFFNIPVMFQFDTTTGEGEVPVKYRCINPASGHAVGKGLIGPV
ncbi:MAG: hypothetical protein HS116_06650 [Planctomycetes bacterium]|nr:hypothetical protein [Planctomycetota bacterium]